MPTFDFQCAKCDHVFEFTRAFGDKTNPKCPECGSAKTEKMIAPPAVHFKGSGWYKTDSKAATLAPSKKKDEKKMEESKTEAKTTEPKKEKPPKSAETSTSPLTHDSK